MRYYFETEENARGFIVAQTKDRQQIQTEIFHVLSNGIIRQEHFTYFDFIENVKYSVSFFEVQKGYEIEINTKKLSALVFAAEIGDLELFQKEVQKQPTVETLALAFVFAIYDERVNILEFYYSAGYIHQISSNLYKDPIITTTIRDSIKSFQFFLLEGLQLPDDILARIFHENSNCILKYIIGDAILCKEILGERFKTSWALKALDKRDNESTRMFRDFLN